MDNERLIRNEGNTQIPSLFSILSEYFSYIKSEEQYRMLQFIKQE